MKLMKLKRFKYFYPEAPRLIHIDQPMFQEFSDSPYHVAEKKLDEKRLELWGHNKAWEFWNRHGELLNYTPSDRITISAINLVSGQIQDNAIVSLLSPITKMP